MRLLEKSRHRYPMLFIPEPTKKELPSKSGCNLRANANEWNPSQPKQPERETDRERALKAKADREHQGSKIPLAPSSPVMVGSHPVSVPLPSAVNAAMPRLPDSSTPPPTTTNGRSVIRNFLSNLISPLTKSPSSTTSTSPSVLVSSDATPPLHRAITPPGPARTMGPGLLMAPMVWDNGLHSTSAPMVDLFDEYRSEKAKEQGALRSRKAPIDEDNDRGTTSTTTPTSPPRLIPPPGPDQRRASTAT